ncbi:MAG: thioredoxin [Verrucomicrobiota bacterium]|nr:thioredoxin [Verrucomicrobiota bacterium]
MKKWLVVVAALAIGTGMVVAEEKAKVEAKAKEVGAVIELNKVNFDKTLKAGGVVLVDFWAPWCPPCRVQGPILDELAKAIGEDAVIGKVNVDDSGELASKFGIQSIPTLIVFKDGELKERLVGVHQKDDLVEIIKKAK